MSTILNFATSTLGSMYGILSLILFTSSLTLFFLEDLKFSKIRLIKYIQIFSFICIPIYITYNMYKISSISLSDMIFGLTDNKDVFEHNKVDKEAGKALNPILQTI
jgi:hypothetical protein